MVIEQNDEWLVGRRYVSAPSVESVLDRDQEEQEQEEVREFTPALAAADRLPAI